MKPSQRIVMKMPLDELWDDHGPVAAVQERFRDVTRDEMRDMIKVAPVRFVVARPAEKLLWLSTNECYEFWKTELKDHIYDPKRKYLEEYPGQYFYFASTWRLSSDERVIVLELMD